LEVTPDNDAVIVVVAVVIIKEGAVANPCEPVVLLIMATFVFEEDHVAEDVMSCKLPSVKVPVAKNCWVPALVEIMIVAVSGVTTIDTSCRGVTVKVALFDVWPERLAVINADPSDCVVANPFEPVVLLTKATVEFEEFHVADAVISWSDASENDPTAVNCCVFPKGTFADDGVTVIAVRTAGVTIQVDAGLDTIKSNIAVTSVVPVLRVEMRPLWPDALLNEATFGSDESHIAHGVTFCTELSARTANAANCSAFPLAMLAVAGEVVMEATADDTSAAVPVTPP